MEEDISGEVGEAVLKKIQQLDSDIVNIYSPATVTRTAKQFGFNLGEAMDLTMGLDFVLERYRPVARDPNRDLIDFVDFIYFIDSIHFIHFIFVT